MCIRDRAKPVGGHAVVLAGYDAVGARVISWGMYYTMTWEFFAHFVDEVYAIADTEWFTAKGTSPGGLTPAELEAQMPVSYTHLDVYKRQAQSGRSRMARSLSTLQDSKR